MRNNRLFTLWLLCLEQVTFFANAFSAANLLERNDLTKAKITPGKSEPSSITLLQRPCPVKNAWDQLVPPVNLLLPKQTGCDITVEWKFGEDLTQVATFLLEGTPATAHWDLMNEYLVHCLQEFQSFCTQHLRMAVANSTSCGASCCAHDLQGFKARIVATRGATKCPRWHLDHVPVRWIHSLVGPGCDYLLDGYDDSLSLEDLQDSLNESKRDNNPRKIRQAKEQEVALLVGNQWKEFAQPSEPFLPPVLHKSPDIPIWQGRVLLTMDVVVPYYNDD